MSLFSSLTNRIFIGSAVIVAVATGLAVVRVDRVFTARAEDDLRQGVFQAAALVADYVSARQTRFVSEARLIVEVPRLSNALATDDPPTVQGVAAENAALVAADVFLVLGRDDRVLARVGEIPASVVPSEAILAARPKGHDATWFSPYSGGLLQLTALPMPAGASPPLGTLILGFSLDQAAVDIIKQRTKTDIALVADGQVLASTLGSGLASVLPNYTAHKGPFDVPLGADEFTALVQPLGSDSAPRDPHAPAAIVLRDRTESLRVLHDIRRDIGLAGLAVVVVATFIGYLVARTVTRPLRAVTATMRTMAATGDLAQVQPPVGAWDDEDARLLANTFRQLTAALDRFQREAAQRERLSSLGRLSTVVAHEVRNPLMIIKSAVRTLRRQPSPEVAEIAASIDEEVSRLNRVVTGVLDFARPIRFDLAPADLVEICRDAANAVKAGPEAVPIAFIPPEATLPFVTDAERLRAVLVNLLSNAQQAVRARGGRAEPGAIRLSASRTDTGGWRIEVTDRGAGIPAEDLPRLFEPFFTTKKTGSGLGLPLSRNIVEGLGGSLVIGSTVGVGTTARIDLPDRASAAREVSA